MRTARLVQVRANRQRWPAMLGTPRRASPGRPWLREVRSACSRRPAITWSRARLLAYRAQKAQGVGGVAGRVGQLGQGVHRVSVVVPGPLER